MLSFGELVNHMTSQEINRERLKIEIQEIHPLGVESKTFKSLQTSLIEKINLHNTVNPANLNLCAGVDVAYWEDEGIEWGICSIVVIDYETMAVVEKVDSTGEITVPYIPGYLAFRELPLILEAVQKLIHTPDLFLFDGNGYLHPRHMGIATHASFFLNKPTIGIAKNYFKIDGVDFKMPENKAGAFEDIIVKNEIYGRTLRTHPNVSPIFISCGNYIDLPTATEITLKFINKESRLPIPVRLADLETRQLKRRFLTGKEEFE